MASPHRPPIRRRAPAPSGAPRVRRSTIRVTSDVAWRVRAGHPWIYREALGGRPLREPVGAAIDVLDGAGGFVARGLFDPTGTIAVRVFTRDSHTVLDATTLRLRVERARRLRERYVPAACTAYRVLHGEGDGVPGITVDRYADYLVAQLYSPAIEPLLPSLLDALESTWKPRGIYAQSRFKPQTGEGPRAPAELVRGETAPVEIEVREGDLRFAVDVTAPLGTGLFLDLRKGREAIARLAAGKRVLNLFSYTGAFSLHAARGGAREVLSVDLATKAHARARHNLSLNGLPETGHEFIAGDAIKVLARLAERNRRFDLIILDPPSFAQARGQVFVAQKDYRDLVEAALAVAEDGALLACASNTAKLPLEDFDRILGDGAARARRSLVVIDRIGLPPDFPVPAGFPEGHYLKLELCSAE